MLDPFLAPHVNKLLGEIRKRALVQYFTPYSSVDMNKMAESFEATIGETQHWNSSYNLLYTSMFIGELEGEISSLILDGKIQGRIDANAKILYSRSVDPRMLSFKHVLEAGRTYKQQTTYLLLRANMMKQKVSVGQLQYASYDQEVDYL